MKTTILTIVFIIVAIAVLGGGYWYSQKMSANQLVQTQDQSAATSTGVTAVTSGGAVTISTSTPAQTKTNSANTTQTMADGLQIKDAVVGTGAEAKAGDTVNVLYTGSLDNGTVFDASSKHGNQPFSFTLGAGQVIKGWDEGVAGMKVGGTRELVIPAALGYGANGAGGVIPPNATLHFTVQLLSIGQ